MRPRPNSASTTATNRSWKSPWSPPWPISPTDSTTASGSSPRNSGVAVLSGVNPVLEALRAGRPLERILVARGASGPRVQEIVETARRASVPLRFEPRQSLDRLAGSPAHQGVVALGAA